MSGDGYVLIRAQSLAWLLEHCRRGEVEEIPLEVARDLREVAATARAPEPEDRVRALGPVLSTDQHRTLLLERTDLNLPRGSAGEFWQIVVSVVHGMLQNEAEAVLQLIGGRDGKE